MKTIAVVRSFLLLAVMFASGAVRADPQAEESRDADVDLSAPLTIEPAPEAAGNGGVYLDPSMRVSRINGFGRYQSWSPVDRDRIIVWVTSSRPYLVELFGGSASLRFSNAIGFTTLHGALTDFDAIVVDGRRLPIKAIYKLSKEQAEAMLRVA